MLSRDAGTSAVRHARAEAEAEVRRARARAKALAPPGLEEPRGAFVSLHREADGELRGCVGYVQPREPLHEVLAQAARGAVRDPRFDPVLPRELAGLLLEVSVLTQPRALPRVEAAKLPDLVRIGDDGLVVEAGRHRGLLLPQVALEQGFTAEAFLSACCEKAGLDAEAWRERELRWSVFQAQVFRERSPGGAVEAATSERPEVA
jgi:hypothetical protein